MAKKLSLLLAAVAVLAFAVPAMASASTGLTNAKSELVPVGTAIKGVNVGTVTTTTTKVGNIECASVELQGKLTANSAAGVAGEGTGEGTASTCNVGENKVSIEKIKLVSLSSSASEAGTGKASFSFTANLPGGIVCNFESVSGGSSGTYVSGSSELTFTKAALNASPAACGKATLDGTFKLSAGGAAVFIM